MEENIAKEEKKESWFKDNKEIVFFLIIGVIVLIGFFIYEINLNSPVNADATYNIKPNSNPVVETSSNISINPPNNSISTNSNYNYNDQGVSNELIQKEQSIMIDGTSNQIDCSNPLNYNKSSFENAFYITSQWIPSTNEGMFDTESNVGINNGCTNLYPEYITKIIFNSNIIQEYDSSCYDYMSSVLLPTQTTDSAGEITGAPISLSSLLINQTGKYLVQRQVIDCKTNQTLSTFTIGIDVGNTIGNYYNKVDFINPNDSTYTNTLQIIDVNTAFALNVTNEIAALQISLNKTGILQAQIDYSRLDSQAKKLVTNYNLLQQDEADQASALNVTNEIAALPDISVLALFDGSAVTQAQTDYNSLNSQARGLVTDYDILTADEVEIISLQATATQYSSGINNSQNLTSSPSISSLSVWNKTSSYTLDDCLSACEKYCIQMQTDVCQSSCEMIGKEGQTMDSIVNEIKSVTTNLNC